MAVTKIPGVGSVAVGPGAPPPPPTPTVGPGEGTIVVDTDGLHKFGEQLVEPADDMGAATDHIETQVEQRTKYGDPPWGRDDQIGKVFKWWYEKNAPPVIKAVREVQEGIYNTAGLFGVSSKKYVVTEDTNMPG